MTRVRVVGAGLSGLAAAWYLTQLGIPAEVIEATGRAGGLIGTGRPPEGLVETAANAFVGTERVRHLFRALGIAPAELQQSSRRRYVFRAGRARRWPLGASETVAVAARLTHAWTTARLRPRDHETVDDWARRVAGSAAADVLIDPIMRGVYAAPAAQLSARAVVGRRAGGRAGRLMTPAGGMGELIDRLVHALARRGVDLELNRPAVTLDWGHPTVIATGAPAAARLLTAYAPAAAEAIAAIRMRSLLTVTAFFAPHDADVHGFGVLFPRSEQVHALGVLFNRDIFSGRSALRSETWIYDDLEIERRLPATLMEDRRALTGRSQQPAAFYATPRRDAIPVYDRAVLMAQREAQALPPFLALAGNYLGRLGVAKLLDVAAEAAGRMADALGVDADAGVRSR